jgi:cystathionine beta-lyase/cystathionine gamma-synthase
MTPFLAKRPSRCQGRTGEVGGFEAADAFLGRLRYARRSASLGGVDSLAAADAAAACT